MTPVDDLGERFDLEYLDAGEVAKYRPNVPKRTVGDLERLEGWQTTAEYHGRGPRSK